MPGYIFSKSRTPVLDWLRNAVVWGPWHLQQGVHTLSHAMFVAGLLSQNQQLHYTDFVHIEVHILPKLRDTEDYTCHCTWLAQRKYAST